MFCSKCGKEIDDSMEFCPYCGTKNILQQNGDTQYDFVSKRDNEDRSYVGNPFKAINSEKPDEDRRNVDLDRRERYVTQERSGVWESIKTLVTTVLLLAGVAAVIIWVIIPWFRGNNNSDLRNQTQSENVKTTVSESNDSKAKELVNYINEYSKPIFEKESVFIDKYNLFQNLEIDFSKENQVYYDHLVESKQLADELKAESDRIQKSLRDEKIKKVNQILVNIASDYCKIMDSYESEYNECINNDDPDKIYGLDFFGSTFRNNITVLMNEIDKLYDSYNDKLKSVADEYGVTLTNEGDE